MKIPIKLYEYRISKDEFDSLDENARAILAVSCYAVTENNILSKIYIQCAPDMDEQSPVVDLNSIQRFMILRIWSAKLFEYKTFIEGIKVDEESELRKIKERSLRCFSRIERRSRTELFRIIRHEATNHYSVKAAKKNLHHIEAGAILSLKLHEMDGNSYYPLGEEIMFSGRLNRFTANKKSSEARLGASQEWMSFNQEVTRWMRLVHGALVRSILFSKFPGRRAPEKLYWLPEDHVADFDQIKIPLFLRRSVR